MQTQPLLSPASASTIQLTMSDNTMHALISALTILTKTHTSVALMTIQLQFDETSTLAYKQEVMASCVSYIRALIRKTDLLMSYHDTLYCLLPGVTHYTVAMVHQRIWDAFQQSQSSCFSSLCIGMGYETYPVPCHNVKTCIQNAQVIRKTSSCVEPSVKDEAPELDLPVLAQRLGVPYLSLLPHTQPRNVRALLSPQLARELCCYIVGRERDILTVAMSNPQDTHVLDRLQKATGLQIFPVLADPRQLRTVLANLI